MIKVEKVFKQISHEILPIHLNSNLFSYHCVIGKTTSGGISCNKDTEQWRFWGNGFYLWVVVEDLALA